MKWILVLTVLHLNGYYEASSPDMPKNANIVTCTETGRAWAEWYFQHIPDVNTVTWKCIRSDLK